MICRYYTISKRPCNLYDEKLQRRLRNTCIPNQRSNSLYAISLPGNLLQNYRPGRYSCSQVLYMHLHDDLFLQSLQGVPLHRQHFPFRFHSQQTLLFSLHWILFFGFVFINAVRLKNPGNNSHYDYYCS